MNPFSSLTGDLQGQLDNFSNRLRSSHYSKNQSRMRGGDKGDVIPSGYRVGKLGQFDKRQNRLYRQSFEDVGPDSYLSKLARGDEDVYNEIEAPAFRQFNELQGGLASRFSGMGVGARNSSGFQNTSNQYTSDFAQDLAAKRHELKRQSILDLQGLSRELLGQRPDKKFLVKKDYPQQQPDQSGDLLGGLLNGLAGAGAGYATGGVPGGITGGASGFYRGYTGGY